MSTIAEPRRASLLWRLVLGSVILAALSVAVGMMMRRLGSLGVDGRLASALAAVDLAEPGWRLEEVESARPILPAAENSALVVADIYTRFSKSRPTKVYPLLESANPTHCLSPESLALVAVEMAKVEPALVEVRRLATMPAGRLEIDLTPPILGKDDPHTAGINFAAGLARLDAKVQAHQGNATGALLACRAALNVARSVGEDPILRAQRARCSDVIASLSTIEGALALALPIDSDLADLAALVAAEERHPTGRVCVRAALAEQHVNYLWLEANPPTGKGLKHLFAMKEGFAEWRDNLIGTSVSDLRLQHAVTLELLAESAETSRLPSHEQLGREAATEAKHRELLVHHRYLHMMLPSMRGVSLECRRKLARARAMLVLLAVERHRCRFGEWPASLESVPKDLLDTVPPDPWDGKPFRYKRLPDGAVAYSIGEDGKDDGGQVDQVGTRAALDAGHRLWDAAKRRQPAK